MSVPQSWAGSRDGTLAPRDANAIDISRDEPRLLAPK